jgi:hypothetical protein
VAPKQAFLFCTFFVCWLERSSGVGKWFVSAGSHFTTIRKVKEIALLKLVFDFSPIVLK